MAPIVKAKDRTTGDKVHLGDAHAAWMSMVEDDDHGHYLILTYNDAKHKVRSFTRSLSFVFNTRRGRRVGSNYLYCMI